MNRYEVETIVSEINQQLGRNEEFSSAEVVYEKGVLGEPVTVIKIHGICVFLRTTDLVEDMTKETLKKEIVDGIKAVERTMSVAADF